MNCGLTPPGRDEVLQRVQENRAYGLLLLCGEGLYPLREEIDQGVEVPGPNCQRRLVWRELEIVGALGEVETD